MGGSPHVDMYGMCRFQSDRLSGSTVRAQVFYCISAQPGSAAITTHAKYLVFYFGGGEMQNISNLDLSTLLDTFESFVQSLWSQLC